MSFRFDVFLSYATRHRPIVEEMARRLERENLKPWLDRWRLIPGDPVQPAMEAALVECAACAVFIGPGEFGPWQNEEIWLAIDRRVNDPERAFRVIPVLLPGVERPERSRIPGFLRTKVWVEFRETIDDPEAFHQLLSGIRGIEPGAGPGGASFEGRNPYRGLELFDVEHAPLFFGREAMTGRLLDALRRKPSGAENRFLAIVGASGSGKSSLARTGLLAALKDDKLDGSDAWPRAISRPGTEPFFSLANALAALAPEALGGVVFDRLQDRKDGERSLHVAAGLVLGEPPRAARLVLLVNQFEEVFTTCTDEIVRRDFIANLLHASTVAGGRTIVVLAMRADFYHRCAEYDSLAAALSDHQLLVPPMTVDELRRAIERPARLAGLEPEPGLIELLVDDVRGRPGALPLLQFALQELWQRREAHRLTIRAYREIGQIEGALQRKADAVYEGFTPEQQELCRRIFLRLVQPGEGTEDTRRRASLSEVLPKATAQAGEVRVIIGRLTDPESRLLTTGRDQPAGGDGTLEVAHEALIRGWPRLREWIEADRSGLRTHRRLTEAAREWADVVPEGKEGSLYVGARLAMSTEWAVAHQDDLSPLEADYLSASQEHERQQKANEAEKNRLLAEAHSIAASRQLAALSVSERNKRLDLSLLLAVEALQAANTFEARDSLFKALHERPALDSFLRSEEGEMSGVAFSPDGKTIAGYSARSGGVVLWDLADRQRLADEPLAIKEGYVKGVAFSPDGKTIAAGYHARGGGGVALWDLADRQRLAGEPLAIKEGEVSCVAYSPDGKTIAVGYGARVVGGEVGGVVLWDVDLKSWQSRGGKIANRNFTRDEWRRYFPKRPYRPTFPELPVPPEVIKR